MQSFRLIARAQSIEEADRIAKQYEIQGFESKIIRKKQGMIEYFEVWISRKPDILFADGKNQRM